MDDNLLFYLVVIGIGLLSQLFGKKKKNLPEDGPEESSRPEITFEDLLREFKSKQDPAPAPKEIRRESVEIEKPREKSYEFSESRFPDDDDEIDNVYQNAIKDAQRKLNDPEVHPEFSHFKEYDSDKTQENDTLAEIKESLSDRNSLVKALILSEILNRKY